MLYRFFAAMIVVFWLTMTALLIRNEVGPGGTSLREVPLAHVLRTMFGHGQASDLLVYGERQPVGHFRLQPRTESARRKMDFNGTLQVALPEVGRQRVAWTSELDFDPRLEAQRFKGSLSYRDPAPHMLDLEIDVPNNRLTYETRIDAMIARRGGYSLDEKGAHAWLRDEGIDPALLGSFHHSHSKPMEIKARQSRLEVRGENIETWLVSAEQGGQTLIEAHVSQLGQILRVRTFLGYSAAPEGMAP